MADGTTSTEGGTPSARDEALREAEYLAAVLHYVHQADTTLNAVRLAAKISPTLREELRAQEVRYNTADLGEWGMADAVNGLFFKLRNTLEEVRNG
jgi:hypothetical protein